jgi:hypothetical protein
MTSIVKFDAYGDKMESRILEEFWHFTAHENGGISGTSVRGSMRSDWLVGLSQEVSAREKGVDHRIFSAVTMFLLLQSML